MPDIPIRQNSLVLYHMRPARIRETGEKLTLELEGGETVRVRTKDVVPLHPGPLHSLAELRQPVGADLETAWEILSGQETSLPELAELAFGEYSPAAAWAAWQQVVDGVYFRGIPERITVTSADEVAHVRATRAAEAAEKTAWDAFLSRARAGQVEPEDRRYLREVEDLALRRSERSRVMRSLGREETPENAHATLLELGAWDATLNPYPVRLGLNLTPPDVPLPEEWFAPGFFATDATRRDLTHLPAYAIDDVTTETPDDALSFESTEAGERIWVHVADPAVLAPPGSPLDLEARARGVTLHLPEAVVPMLPPATTPLLGLGLAEVSPALSFALDVDESGQPLLVEIVPSLVRVTRLTYDVVDARLTEEPFASLRRLTQAYEAMRRVNGALSIDLPEAAIRVRDGEICIRPVLRLASRNIVENTMVMTGDAIARYAIEQGIPLPFATQDPPDNLGNAQVTTPSPGEEVTLSEMFALRRTLKRSQYRSAPASHTGLGLGAYVQVTSPLRRCLDLVVHQQLRGHLAGAPLLTSAEIIERIGEVEPAITAARQAENLSNRHWTLLYLERQPGWQGEAVLVDRRGQSGVFVIPELAMEAQMHLPAGLPLDSRVTLVLRSVDLPRQDARFRVEKND
jgi:exoribonuclease II